MRGKNYNDINMMMCVLLMSYLIQQKLNNTSVSFMLART